MDFRGDTPPEVLASVAALHRPIEEDAWWGPEPALPEPVREPTEYWAPDWRAAGDTDAFESEPWRHDWSPWLGGSMSVTTIPQSGLVWSQTKHWSLACRCSFKSWAEQVFTFLQWL